jgi:precorrin-3B C17-methyltransferase
LNNVIEKEDKKLYVIGLGPGAYEDMTMSAVKALNRSKIIIGYTVYVDLIKEYFMDKEYLTTPMKKEVERCEMALRKANEGHICAMICSGDSGIYGMAGLVLELADRYPEVNVEIISGVTAASAGAAVLGAPIMHDFAVISMSDLLTPIEVIEKRLYNAAEANFVIAIYNPVSKKRHDYLKKACEIVLKCRSENTVCGVVRNIGRIGEKAEVMTLLELKDFQADMFTTVFIGNEDTKNIAGKMVTPRGYKDV